MKLKFINCLSMGNSLRGKSHSSFEIIILLLSTLVVYAVSQEETGDWCLSEDGDDGICIHLRHCPRVQKKAYVYNGGGETIPGLCSYGSSGPIVCCPIHEESQSDEKPADKDDVAPGQPVLSEDDAVVVSAIDIIDSGLRVSERKCREYTQSVSQGSLFPKGDNGYWCPSSPNQLIVGGRNAETGEYPHLAALGYLKKTGLVEWQCSGSLISESYVLTAAHCTSVDNGRLIAVGLGQIVRRPVTAVELRFALTEQSDEATDIFAVSDAIRNPSYSSFAHYNDIALIRLAKPVKKFTLSVRPACLYMLPDVTENRTVAAGFGFTHTGDTAATKQLRIVDLSVHGFDLCNKLYKALSTTSKLSKGIVDSMLCAGELAGGKDTCEGDSGGPLQIRDPTDKCTFRIAGILSFGPASCGSPNNLAVYTKVSHFLSWIESVVWPE